jgi:hypothetical protein
MAQFSQGFLSSLGRPEMSQSLFGLGAAIGGVPGQMKQRQKEQAFNQLMQQGQQAMASGDAAALANISQQLAASGYQREAQQLSQASREASQKAKLQGVLSGVDLQTPEGLGTLSEYYRGEGNAAQAIELATQQRKLQKQTDDANKFVQRKVNLSNTALKLNQPDLAERIQGITDPEELRTIATEIRKTEVNRMPTQNPLVRKQMARAAGITDESFAELDLAKVPDSVFTDYITGQKGKMEFFLQDGKLVDYRVNETGLVWDRDTDRWSEASQLGLQPAPPQVQKVQNITAGMGDELAKAGAKSFSELAENAAKAADALSSINRSMPNLNNMFTGAGAEIKLNVVRYAETLGIPLADPSSIVDTEAYIADSGRRVAQYIVNLGAGTGLSDADRKYAERVVAGDITLDKGTLKRLLEDMGKGARNNIEKYKKIRGRVKASLGESGEAALAWFPEDFYVDEGPAPVRSKAADSFLDAATAP